ncbi:unnamed protein product [Danaus chrysippus]|uniref:(African queen) hypothetical protein n=1 Tax=Danaus chrysippus TaxID=151541 RepID=A0A8J2QE22_9NEOP|nr:unnamed protein product [Danaus chrysippus]
MFNEALLYKWKCHQKPDGSSSDYELYHEPHKRCYLQLNVLRYNGHMNAAPMLRSTAHATTQLSHVTRSSRRTAPAHTLSADMLQRHGHIDYTR